MSRFFPSSLTDCLGPYSVSFFSELTRERRKMRLLMRSALLPSFVLTVCEGVISVHIVGEYRNRHGSGRLLICSFRWFGAPVSLDGSLEFVCDHGALSNKLLQPVQVVVVPSPMLFRSTTANIDS